MQKIFNFQKFNESLDINQNVKRVSVDMPLPQDIIDIANAYIKVGKDIFVVGGAVRDFIQNKSPKDFDLVTNALPEESKQILSGFNVSDEQGKNFGVLRVYTKSEPAGYEIASYRKDISKGRDTKGDDQKVELGKHITVFDDCMRRDLTMNALFYDITRKEIIDIVGGIDDIKNNIVRAVGDPTQRFIEDRLRICRVFRFAARTGGNIDISTANAIKSDNRLRGISPKDNVSQERIWEEIVKAYKQVKDFKRYLNFYTEFDMWDQVFPGYTINTDVKETESLVCYIANLFVGNDFENKVRAENYIIQKFKVEGETATLIVFLNRLFGLNSDTAFQFYKDKVRCEEKLGESINNIIEEWFDLVGLTTSNFMKFTRYKPTTSSEELMKRGLSGNALGNEIKRLEKEAYELLK